jgi:hypothetical protein
MRSALGQHFDSSLIYPVKDVNLVRNAGVVGGVKPAKFEVREEGREIVSTLGSPTYCWSRHSGVPRHLGSKGLVIARLRFVKDVNIGLPRTCRINPFQSRMPS